VVIRLVFSGWKLNNLEVDKSDKEIRSVGNTENESHPRFQIDIDKMAEIQCRQVPISFKAAKLVGSLPQLASVPRIGSHSAWSCHNFATQRLKDSEMLL